MPTVPPEMFTHCPECHAAQPISTEQLRQARGLAVCSDCGTRFDALASLAEQPLAPPVASQATGRHTTTNTTGLFRHWRYATLAMLGLLIVQIIAFERQTLLNTPWLRQLASAGCNALGCTITPYRNLEELSVLHSSLQTIAADRGLLFKAVVANQSAFAQAFPGLRLNLIDFNGRTFASRAFLPQEYLPAPRQLAANAAEEIALVIAAPDIAIGGYTFSLL